MKVWFENDLLCYDLTVNGINPQFIKLDDTITDVNYHGKYTHVKGESHEFIIFDLDDPSKTRVKKLDVGLTPVFVYEMMSNKEVKEGKEYPKIKHNDKLIGAGINGDTKIDIPQATNLIIHGFMGGTLCIPLSVGDEHTTKAMEFITKLYEIPGVKELFEQYGAEFKASDH